MITKCGYTKDNIHDAVIMAQPLRQFTQFI